MPDTARPTIDPDPVVDAFKKGVDRTLLRERLKRTPTERVEDLAALEAFAEELAAAGAARDSRDRFRGADPDVEPLRDQRPSSVSSIAACVAWSSTG